MGYGSMQGIPMVASSPVRHDSPLNLHGLDVTSYQPPWKALSDFALHADLDGSNGSMNHTPAFQHLVNQVSHTFHILTTTVVVTEEKLKNTCLLLNYSLLCCLFSSFLPYTFIIYFIFLQLLIS